jgi:hypothetical protein
MGIKVVVTLLLLLVAAVDTGMAQSRRIQPPQPYYPQYGSMSRQMTVYRNLRLQNEQMERNRVRRIRDELEKRERGIIIHTTRGSNYDRVYVRRSDLYGRNLRRGVLVVRR